jgi:tetratricopeptide (TPR) repeat protein
MRAGASWWRLLAVVVCAAGCGTGRKAQWEGAAVVPHAPPATAAAAAAPTGVEVAAAEVAWTQRGDRAALEKAIALWEAEVARNPGHASTWARLSRAYYLLADGHLRTLGPSNAQYLTAFEKGTAAGERSLAAQSPEFRARVLADEKVEEAIRLVGRDGIPAMYWYAANLAKWSRATGIVALLKNKDRVRGVVGRVLELDENFFHGAPHRYFGAYWALLPIGRDLDKSRTHFDRSLAIAPAYAGTKVLMAETYAVKKQDRALFLRLLDEVLALPDDAVPDLVPEIRIEKDKARELKARVDELF